ncbi:para-aminobenzoate synthase, (PABA) [Stygiomarasmius scandens]|uniref:Para-aminobenzoate synthase, (PABA) n=1 Tax=Marasmiellus scandens TaxID=2682957 RepID=A0ABR1JT82_9AGAR
MIIEKSDILKPPAPLRATRSPSPAPPPIHPRVHYSNTPTIPPSYKEFPRASITYVFTPLPHNAMRLASPEPPVPGAQQPYHISVSLNCFTPSSYITSIRRNKEDGELVGDFEMGSSASKIPSTVCFKGNEHPIDDILVNSSRLFRNYWIWKSPDPDKYLYWDDNAGGGVITCFSTKDRTSATFLAKFSPRSHLRRQGRPTEYTKLEVAPLGHHMFEDILMSALIIERLRTNPT